MRQCSSWVRTSAARAMSVILLGPMETWRSAFQRSSSSAKPRSPRQRRPAIDVFNAETGRSYSLVDFLEYGGWRSLESFALEAARSARPRVDDVGREELIEIVRRIQASGPDNNFYLSLFRANTPRPHASDLIFHPRADLVEGSADAIVDAALAHLD